MDEPALAAPFGIKHGRGASAVACKSSSASFHIMARLRYDRVIYMRRGNPTGKALKEAALEVGGGGNGPGRLVSPYCTMTVRAGPFKALLAPG